MANSLIAGYPPHFWIEPYREVMARICMGNATSLAFGRDDKLIEAARELAQQGWIQQEGGRFTAAGLTYIRFIPTARVNLRELKHGY